MTTTFAVPTLRPAGLVDAIRSEWTKLRSVRSTFWTLLAATVLTIGLGALISNGFAGNYSSSSPSDQATFDPTNISLTGLILGQLAIGVLGVLTVTSEYSTGMIRTSLAAVPRRGRLLVATPADSPVASRRRGWSWSVSVNTSTARQPMRSPTRSRKEPIGRCGSKRSSAATVSS